MLYRFKCDHCQHEFGAAEKVMYVILEDDSDKSCPHPCEFLVAEKATGKAMWELQKSRRIIYRFPLVCFACGEVKFYGPRDLNVILTPRSRFISRVLPTSKSAAGLYECKSCGQKTLKPLAPYASLWRTLLTAVGIKRWNLDCRQCNEGKYVPNWLMS